MRARQERDDGLFAGVRRSMAYDQLPGAERRLDRAVALGDQEEFARATRALIRVREEIDDCGACSARLRGGSARRLRGGPAARRYLQRIIRAVQTNHTVRKDRLQTRSSD